MILKELKIRGFRSFCEEDSLELEPDVTILTGPNDVGKTAVLHSVRMMYRNEKGVESDANYAASRRARPSDKNDHYKVSATFIPSRSNLYLYGHKDGKMSVDVEYFPELPDLRLKGVFDEGGKNRMGYNNTYKLEGLPPVVDLAYDEEIRTSVRIEELNPSEDRLMSVAFGHSYKEQLPLYSDEKFRSEIRGGVKSLNLKLKRVLPKSLSLGFEIAVEREDSSKLWFSVGVTDALTGDTPIHLRGSGARKILRLLASLVDIDISDEHLIIIVDEPEASLHADAQHALRYVLETLGREPRVQVIYATHSSCMINTTRPRCLRLLNRIISPNGNPTTRINNEPYRGGRFQIIRSSLGMSPADSLLYAAITVIVEGETEEQGLRQIVEKVIDVLPDAETREELEILYGQIHIVSADGYSEIHKWVKLAKSQGSQPIAFLDGDHYRKVLAKLEETHSEVPVIHMDDGKDFEEIVSKRAYFTAVADIVGTTEGISAEEFDHWYIKWLKEPSSHEIGMFSNRVKKWTETVFGRSLSKPKVMLRAIEIAEPDEIDLEKIGELTRAIRMLANRL